MKELQLRGRLANQWVKEMFREKYESSGESRRDGQKSKERIPIEVATEDQDSAITSAEVAGESTPVAPEDVKYTT